MPSLVLEVSVAFMPEVLFQDYVLIRGGLGSSGCPHGKQHLSWQQQLSSVFVVLVVCSVFACEEPELTKGRRVTMCCVTF